MSVSEASFQRIETCLRAALSPVYLELEDESANHIGHTGAAGGGRHYRLTLVADRFEGIPRLKRHRMIYDVLAHDMRGTIHALAIRALTPSEWEGERGE